MDKLEKILTILHLENLYQNFKNERIDVEIVSFLTEQELHKLGVVTIEDRTKLKRLCRSELTGGVIPRSSWPIQENTRVKEIDTKYSHSSHSSHHRQATEGSASGYYVDMGDNSAIRIGDRDNNKRTGDTVEADEIERVETEVGRDVIETSTNRQASIPQNSQFRIGKNAVFDIGNHNNVTTTGSHIKAKKIGFYTSKVTKRDDDERDDERDDEGKPKEN